jgi:hypothetical protein
MKKRTREISVDGRRYVWTVVELMWPARVLRVWKAEDRRTVWFEQQDAKTEPVTPQQVADSIRKHATQDAGEDA